ncbi:hypothetical protein N752_25165 [Desulforamulus aquiferis]|nr:Arm DNA-binding domain-containing protein [Desulforamulus aquiferis]RYD02621.1 hypothetical protein N752_25165 [Desulforamulus aquiferis]
MAGHIRKRSTKSGNKWQVVFESGKDSYGKRKRLYRNVDTKKEAQQLLAQLISEHENGTYIEPSKITFGQYLDEWIEGHSINLSLTTVESYLVNITKHIKPRIGKKLLQELKPLDLQRLYKELLENGRADGKGGLSPRSVRYIHRNIHEALNHAVKMQIIPRNVAELVSLPKAKPYKAQVYDEDQLINLLKTAQDTDMELPLTLGASLGLRRGEILGLKWSDIDFDGKTLTVNNNLVQTEKGS